jgi:hypothetical protein
MSWGKNEKNNCFPFFCFVCSVCTPGKMAFKFIGLGLQDSLPTCLKCGKMLSNKQITKLRILEVY